MIRLAALRAVRAGLAGLYVLLAAAFVGLSVYAVLQFGLWWPRVAGFAGVWRQLLAVATMLPFLLVFTKLSWSRPLGWLMARFAGLIAPFDRAIDALRER